MRPKEITWQSLVGAFVVSTLIAMSYPYIVLKLGMGPNVSVLAAFLGALFLMATARRTRGQNAVRNNIIQTAATSATSTAFMCVVAAAFGYLNMNESVSLKVHITPWQMFSWLSLSGTIGVLIAALFRRYFIDDPEMIFADGVAAAETINVLDATGQEGGRKMRTLGFGAVVGVVIAFIRDGLHKLVTVPLMMRFAIGLDWSPLSFGTGLLISLNVGLSMLAGTILVALLGPQIMDLAGTQIVQQGVAPQYLNQVMDFIRAGAVPLPDSPERLFLTQHGGMTLNYLRGNHYPIIMLWFMWPATAMMITASLTAVLLKWRSIARMFQSLSLKKSPTTGRREDVSLKTIVWLTLALTTFLAYVQHEHFGMPVWQTVLSIVFSLPLILVGVRVLGETNQGPVSLMANALQAVFRLFSPHIGHNLVAAGMAGDINSQGEGTMQVYKTGHLVGSTPRILTWIQFSAIPIGAASVAIMYPILVQRYGLGEGLTAPTGLKLANMAVLMSKGLSAFPPGALAWTVVAAIVGVFLTLGKSIGKQAWLPSAAAFGFALILPGLLNVPIALGAICGWWWKKVAPEHYDRHRITLASGFIGGEALIAGLLLPILFYFGIIR